MSSSPSTPQIPLEALDLAALIASRVCHDLISPVGAITNGLEVLDDEKDEEMRTFAYNLIKKSARTASAKLQFCRIAFGAAGSAGAEIDLGDAEKVARGFFSDDKIELEWTAPRLLLPKNRVKLMLNMTLIGQAAIPRGGKMTVSLLGEVPNQTIRIVSTGMNARIPQGLEAMLRDAPEHTIDAHAVQPYYTTQLAKAARMDLSVKLEGETVTFEAVTKAAEEKAA